MSKEHTYSNGVVTVVWKKHLCSHSTNCWRGLPNVFKPGQRPWIHQEGADSDAIIAQVKQCPSGALTIRMDAEAGIQAQTPAAAVRVEVSMNGPLLLQGPISVVHGDGRVEEREGRTTLCRCGASANKPYCDGSHRRIGFADND